MRRLLPLGVAAAAAAQVTLWRNCHGPVAAYAGAWLARRDLFQETAFGDSLGMEYHDYNVYHQGGNGRPRVALKSARATDFYVEHLSEYEHAVRRRARDPEVLIRRQAEDAARACDEPRAAADYPAGAAPPLVLIPFWGGLPEKNEKGGSVGNAHSNIFDGERVLGGESKSSDRTVLRGVSRGGAVGCPARCARCWRLRGSPAGPGQE